MTFMLAIFTLAFLLYAYADYTSDDPRLELGTIIISLIPISLSWIIIFLSP